MAMVTQIATAEDCAAVKDLVLELFTWAETQDPDAKSASAFAGLAAELDGLPGVFQPPTGGFLLARDAGRPVGCVAFRKLDGGTAELKRMYVRQDQRGRGIGAQLVAALIEAAQGHGYRRIVLDTFHTMTSAHKIYRGLGFRDLSPPEGLPEQYHGRVLFMGMDLD